MSSFHGISRKSIEFELSKLIDLFEIEQFLEVPLKQCSKGTKQKVGIIQALLANPDVLLLDEPLTGLDSSSQRNLIHLLEKLKKEVTIIFTTHEEVMIEKLANQILYIETRGILVSNEIRKKKRLIKVEFPQKEVFKELDSIHIQYEGNTAVITVDSAMCDQILISLLNKKCSVLEVREMR
jgi:ABC-type multidrug transport system ATPase subunit